jgi:structural maintenance of chromosome 3 (chondroitin sulfate proteoglycan 6)
MMEKLTKFIFSHFRLALKEQKRKELYAKQGRGSQFTSKEQRDQWIQAELRSLKKALSDKREQIDRLTEELKKDAEKKIQADKRIEVFDKQFTQMSLD